MIQTGKESHAGSANPCPPPKNADHAVNRSLSILTYSSLYPNCVQQRHGIFVEQRLLHLLHDFPVTSRVVAPVPWFPFKGKRFGAYGRMAEVPARETRGGVDVYHPRYGVIPALSWRFSPLLMAAGTIGLLRRLHAAQPFDLIDAHFVYPDGAAASLLGRALGVPVAITARGSDLSLMPRYALPRRFIVGQRRRPTRNERAQSSQDFEARALRSLPGK